MRQLDFVTTVGHGDGITGSAFSRDALGFRGRGPSAVITDFGVLEPAPATHELTLTPLHAGAHVEQAQDATGWELKVANDVATTPPPTDEELNALRELVAR